MFGKNDNGKQEEKTTSDEGKTFEKEMVFVCYEDCIYDGVHYRQGHELHGKKCPPHFVLKSAKLEKDER